MTLTLAEKRQGRRPIDFYFRAVADAKSGKVAFVDAFQVLNDIYLGRMNVVNYFFIAESSIRINELNLISLVELKEFKKFMRDTNFIPNVCYNIPLTTRFLQNEKDFSILQDTLHESGFKKGDLVLTFNSSSLVKDGDIAEAKKRVERLRRMGYKIGISGFGAEFNSLDIFAEYNFNQIRVEASYFDSTAPKKKLLQMLIRFCKSNKIDFIVEGVDTPPQLKRFKESGAKYVTGKTICKLNKWVSREMLKLPELTEEEIAEWRKKIEAEKKVDERKAALAETRSRIDAAKAMTEMGTAGKLTANAPSKPAGYKSPYQARLEQQRLMAKKAAQTQVDKKALAEKKKLAERKAAQEKAKLEALGGWGLTGLSGNTPMRNSDADDNGINLNGNDNTDIENQEIELVAENLELTNTNEVETTSKNGEKSSSDIISMTGEDGTVFEFEEFSPEDELTDEDKIKAENESVKAQPDEQLENEVEDDETDNTEMYDLTGEMPQGSYNEEGQWVDADGNVYNGYFDEEGRWIDYGFYGADGQWLDNGYYDEKQQKWIPFGYFDEKGDWVSLI
ncbi:MAG: EAL domain-containing protein [Clostridia bacterium]|nr:EAL domain-containing protein [Clostridia bacterium]